MNIPAGARQEIITVDPEMAAKWLEENEGNRNISMSLVRSYSRDMKAGRWSFTGEPVKFARGGRLLDGQHRLLAVIDADVTLPLAVWTGLDESAQDNMDSGRSRTTADVLAMHGERRATLLQSVATMILSEATGHRQFTRTEKMAVLDSEPNLREIVNNIIPALDIAATTESVLCYCYWQLDKVDSVACAEFFTSLSNLTGLPANSPITALHKRLSVHSAASRNRSGAYRTEARAYILTAWNAWVRGEERSLIKLSYAGGKVAIPEPVAPRGVA